MKDNHCVAVCTNHAGRTIYVGKVKNVNDKELNKLKEEQLDYELEQKNYISKLEKRIIVLELNLKLDRGEITKEEFDKEISLYE